MLKFAANLSMLFTEQPFMNRFAAAAEAGFDAVEMMFPYDHDATAVREALDQHGLRQVLFNLHPGDWAKGDRGMAIFPLLTDTFRASVEQAAAYANTVGCQQLHCLSGILPPDQDANAARATLIDNLRFATSRLGNDGNSVLIEPINTHDMPGYFLHALDDARDIIAAVGAENLRLQYDVYHRHMMGADVIAELTDTIDLIAHIQIADAPGRNEPGTGEIDFARVFAHIDQLGYDGWIGCEYRPRGTTADSLAWRAS